MRDCLLRQFDTAWKLAGHHLDGLTTEECLWRPARAGLHVHQDGDVRWRADWPDRETYDIGPPSIAWLTWHVVFWWSMTLNHACGDGALRREEIAWPGDADSVRASLRQLAGEWRTIVVQLTDADLQSATRTKWPFADRPFSDVVAWVNTELTKNAAEIGYARFLYAVK
jgi:DinB superfamily